MPLRGEIIHRNRAKQINSFTGLIRRRGITPTDIDGAIEYKGNLFIFLEGKHKDALMPLGQKLFLENVCNAITSDNKLSVAILYNHSIDSHLDVDVSECIVKKIFWYGEWKNFKEQWTVKKAVEWLEKHAEDNGIEI